MAITEGGPALNHPRCVGRRVDWLTLAFRVAIPEHTLRMVELRARRAADVGPVELELPSGRVVGLYASRRDGWFRWECAVAAGVIDLTAAGGWNLAVDMSGAKLRGADLPQALELAYGLAADLGDDPGAVLGARLRRVDLAADFAGWVIRRDDAEGWVRQRRAVLAGYVDLDDQGQVRTHEQGRRVTGHTICPGGAIMLRAYDKRAQLAHLGDPEYAAPELESWRLQGVADDEPVTRVEPQIRGEALAEFGPELATLRDNPLALVDNLNGLWRYLVEDWARLVVPGTASRLSRCDLDERWRAVQAVAFGHDVGKLARTRRAGRAVTSQAFGCALSAMADAARVARQLPADFANGTSGELWARELVRQVMTGAGQEFVDQLLARYADAPDPRIAVAEHLRDKVNGALALRG